MGFTQAICNRDKKELKEKKKKSFISNGTIVATLWIVNSRGKLTSIGWMKNPAGQTHPSAYEKKPGQTREHWVQRVV